MSEPEKNDYVTPINDLGAYVQLEDSLVQIGHFNQQTPPEFMQLEREVVGRYSLKRLNKGEPINTSDLGPKLPFKLSGLRIVALPVEDSSTISGGLARGWKVDLVWAPSQVGGEPLTVEGAVILDWVDKGKVTHVVVAVKSEELKEMSRLMGVSKLFISLKQPILDVYGTIAPTREQDKANPRRDKQN